VGEGFKGFFSAIEGQRSRPAAPPHRAATRKKVLQRRIFFFVPSFPEAGEGGRVKLGAVVSYRLKEKMLDRV
jgi:hypothetical protein